ncbi:Baculovirus repeated ORF 10 [Trabala vishnou gigantina nucleopolyhedrovirus]|uniref:Baculovirus repeated ORF 10 n=1 Tax=Trabala vishnou gigantina nucleopolyhedrovirus TaxID=2863583 RepID=UPI002481EAF6|nr:Baculovirus repeated ORF 10 [Trabala vishnou gigantina nucleopolyhedrovirus]QYC92774.1 Baculovirus repeated ORF 10 [Trabala vishnou gigantina nucleopolyhedrovirus]
MRSDHCGLGNESSPLFRNVQAKFRNRSKKTSRKTSRKRSRIMIRLPVLGYSNCKNAIFKYVSGDNQKKKNYEEIKSTRFEATDKSSPLPSRKTSRKTSR